MKYLSLLIIVLVASCSNAPVKRTIKTDKSLRVMVDPSSSEGNYTKVVSALVQSGSFQVIDRKEAYKAIRREQNRLHRQSSDRFAPNQKFSHWGKLYGVGAVVVARSQCRWHRSFWNTSKLLNRCELFLSLVDSNTGEIIISVRDQNDSPQGARPDWELAVQKLSEKYPKYFTNEKIHRRMKEYMLESESISAREKSLPKREISRDRAEIILPHDENFDQNGKLLPPEEVLRRVRSQR